MKRLPILFVATALFGAAPAPGIRVGLVLDDTLGKTVNGWLHTQGSMFNVTRHKDGVSTVDLDCCIAVFSKGRSTIVARTVPLAKNATGGVIKERITDLRRIDLRPGETEMGCGLFTLNLVYSVKNPKTGNVRSIVVDEGGLGTLDWKDDQNRCGVEGD